MGDNACLPSEKLLKHLQNNELSPITTCAKNAQVAFDGKLQSTDFTTSIGFSPLASGSTQNVGDSFKFGLTVL
jgi:hypothetical protein